MWGDESEAVAPIIWLYQTVDSWKEEVFFPDLLITLQRHDVAILNVREFEFMIIGNRLIASLEMNN